MQPLRNFIAMKRTNRIKKYILGTNILEILVCAIVRITGAHYLSRPLLEVPAPAGGCTVEPCLFY